MSLCGVTRSVTEVEVEKARLRREPSSTARSGNLTKSGAVFRVGDRGSQHDGHRQSKHVIVNIRDSSCQDSLQFASVAALLRVRNSGIGERECYRLI